jgi:hypothetical protein
MEGMKVYNLKLGMWVFLLSEVMFFSSLIGAYIILRFAHPEHWAEPNQVLNVPLTGFNTFMLICSSVTMVKAFAAIEHGDQAGLRKWLIATIILGASFVGIQVSSTSSSLPRLFPSRRHAAEGGPAGPPSTMTGFHGAPLDRRLATASLWRSTGDGLWRGESWGCTYTPSISCGLSFSHFTHLLGA